MQAGRIYTMERLQYSRKRTHTVPRSGRGMSGTAVESYAQMLHRQHWNSAVLTIRRMRHHRRIDALEATLLEKDDLAATTFFRRGAHQNDLARKLLAHRCKSGGGGDGRARDKIVSAGMAIRQSIVFRQNCDGRARI